MAGELALTASKIAVVFPEQAEIYTKTCAEAITAGQSLFQDTDGKVQLADANAAGERQTRFLALQAGGSGDAISVLKKGHIYGYTLTAAYDAAIYQSDTTGSIATTAGTVTVPLGVIDGIDQGGTVTKVVYFEARWREDYT